MPDDVATLRDTVVDEPSPVDTTIAPPADVSAPRILEAPNPEAAEIGRILLESGVTKDQLNGLLDAPKALEALRYSIQNNPAEFLNMLERTDPKTGEKFLESMADTYVTRYGDKGKPAGKSGKDDSSTDLMREVEALRNETTQLRTEREREKQSAALAATKQRFDARVEDLLGLKEVKEMGLSNSEIKNLRARLNVELSQDPTVVQRVSNGNFVDVPKAFQGLLQEKADERKAAAEDEKAKRDRTSKNAFSEFQSGPNPFLQDIPTGTFDSWDSTEDGFAKALERVR